VLIAQKAVQSRTAWRVEGTLREFPKFPPINMWFDYPVHTIDHTGAMKDMQPDNEQPSWQRAISKRKPKETKEKERKGSIETAFEACGIDEKVTVSALSEYMGVSEKTVRNRIKEHGGFWIDEGNVGKKT
ncbi:MAG: HTH domain-containing protein, partial [Angelakisella sp.]